jgi:hypothetical protein
LGNAFFSLLFLYSRTMAGPPQEQLPADVTMNKGAGSGTWLIVKLHIGGEELPFMVDTGSPITFFDQSLEPKLGKRLDDAMFTSAAGGKHESGIYLAPKLYLGGAQLATDTYVVSYPFEWLSARSHQRIMGYWSICGMKPKPTTLRAKLTNSTAKYESMVRWTDVRSPVQQSSGGVRKFAWPLRPFQVSKRQTCLCLTIEECAGLLNRPRPCCSCQQRRARIEPGNAFAGRLGNRR